MCVGQWDSIRECFDAKNPRKIRTVLVDWSRFERMKGGGAGGGGVEAVLWLAAVTPGRL